MAYVAIASGDRDPESPITVTLIGRMIDNPIELATGNALSGAPTINRPALEIDDAAGTSRTLRIKTSGVARWVIFGNGGAETGSNAGTDLVIRSYTDAGSTLDDTITINRATGLVTIPSLATGPNGYTAKPFVLIDSGISAGGTGITLSGMSSTYDQYMLVGYNLTRAGSDGALYLRPRLSGADVGVETSVFTLDVAVVSTFEMRIAKPLDTAENHAILDGYDGSTLARLNGIHSMASGTAMDGMRLYTPGNGAFTGSFYLYGRVK